MRITPILLLLFVASSSLAQDTTVVITPYPCDSTITTNIPQQIKNCRDTTVVLSSRIVRKFFLFRLFSWVQQVDVDSTYQVCDTIPPHDTTYNCNLCGTCYDTSYVVNPIVISVRANNQSKVYGEVFTFTNSGGQVAIVAGGLSPGDVISTDNSTSAGAAASAIAGTYTINLSAITIMRGATNVTSSYSISFQPGTLTVTARPITITANNQGKTQGQTFVFTNNGTQVTGATVSGDAIAYDNAASTGAAAGAAAGTYAITLSAAVILKGATDVTSSYSITYQPGTLTVAAAPLLITVIAKNQIKTYGGTFAFTGNGSQVQVTSGGLVPGDVITADNAASSGSGAVASVGSYTISLSAITIMRGAANVTGLYTITYGTGTLSVTAIPITVQANNQTKTQGSVFTFTHDGSQVSVVSGALLSGHAITVDNAASSGSGSGAVAGTYTITVSSITIMNGITNVTSNYTITYQSGTLTVLPVEPPQAAINGMLPNYDETPPLPTLAQRIAYVKSYSCNAYRVAFDDDDMVWQTTQIHSSGLISLLTWNHKPVQQPPDPFPTAATLAYNVNLLDSVLNANQNNLPEIISFNNEEPNSNYWSGPAIDYINWLNAATTVCHSYGVPVSNGGLLQNVVYYIRWIYQQEGKTDSVNLINTLANLWPGTGTGAQYWIDWYKIEIPALAASNIDYINQHWYEPCLSRPANATTSSGLFPIVAQFLRSRTGKTVITTEFGTDNSSQQLFNEFADEIEAAGVNIRVYYAGDGGVSENHAQYWEDWILQNSP